MRWIIAGYVSRQFLLGDPRYVLLLIVESSSSNGTHPNTHKEIAQQFIFINRSMPANRTCHFCHNASPDGSFENGKFMCQACDDAIKKKTPTDASEETSQPQTRYSGDVGAHNSHGHQGNVNRH